MPDFVLPDMPEQRKEMLSRLVLALWIEGKPLGMTKMPSAEACLRILDSVVPLEECQNA